MAKKTTEKIVLELRKLSESDKIIVGTKLTLKGLKLNKLERVYVTSNCPLHVKEDIEQYCSLSGVELVKLKYTNEELGNICKKTFSISVLGLLKG